MRNNRTPADRRARKARLTRGQRAEKHIFLKTPKKPQRCHAAKSAEDSPRGRRRRTESDSRGAERGRQALERAGEHSTKSKSNKGIFIFSLKLGICQVK